VHPRRALPLPHPRLWLALAFLLPNLITLTGGFLYDDVTLLVENERMHSLDGIREVWTESFWPDRPLLTLYRPVTKTLWVLIWVAGGGNPLLFHLFNLLLGTVVVLLLHAYLEELGFPPLTSFLAALLFALFPIHSEAVAPAFGAAELLAAAFGLAALLLHRKGHRIVALLLFALAVFSKESAAAIPALAYFAAPHPRKKYLPDAIAAAAVIAAILVARSLVGTGEGVIPAADNPSSLQSSPWRVMTALWVQCLYLWNTLFPFTLSVEYSYNQIPLVTRLSDIRALIGLGLLSGSAIILWRRNEYAPAVLAWWILFLPAANILFPIGTIMAERLAYLPSAGAALLVAVWLGRRKSLRSRRSIVILCLALFVAYGGRTFTRNLVWTDTDRFYTELVADAPESARAHFGHGVYLSSQGRDAEAVESYAEAIRILPSFADARYNRANALVRLGRNDEAIEEYRRVEQLAPGQTPARQNLMLLLSGEELETRPRRVDGEKGSEQ
jgi:protein O-mannosyl-transferase